MRIAFLFDPKMVRLPFDVGQLWTSPRGLTGSEVTFFRLAAEMAARGHRVSAFSKVEVDEWWRDVAVSTWEDWTTGAGGQLPWDAAVSYISADPLRALPDSTFRVVHQQCRGWSMSSPGWEHHVDLACALSSTHARDLAKTTSLPRERFRILHNGVDLDEFWPGEKVRGRVLWASSPERGLHRLLEAWPRIRRAVPQATLRVAYDQHCLDNTPDAENQARARYIKAALPRLERAGVEVLGSVSRQQIAEEMAAASVLAYPLETSELTETFGCTVLEAMAAGAVPVLCMGDAFGELWGAHAPGVAPPIGEKLDEFAGVVAHMLTDEFRRQKVARACRSYAAGFSWGALAEALERAILTRGAAGLECPRWEEP